ncbi:hypothetical protein ABEZ21_29035 [Brevibacillus porteri]|nr:hypothetical protein [Brevibacillus porteri]MED2746326.1 hypothetical protein [Brevibacillus porteri]MED2817910.1 hypothetical protein [Brevibacillus porteri]MED4899148.1 hypothetical protein [Brevibacillus porteri]
MENDKMQKLDLKFGQICMLIISIAIVTIAIFRLVFNFTVSPFTLLLLSMASVSFAIGDIFKSYAKIGLYAFFYVIAFTWGIFGLMAPNFTSHGPNQDMSRYTDGATLIAFAAPFFVRGLGAVLKEKKKE